MKNSDLFHYLFHAPTGLIEWVFLAFVLVLAVFYGRQFLGALQRLKSETLTRAELLGLPGPWLVFLSFAFLAIGLVFTFWGIGCSVNALAQQGGDLSQIQDSIKPLGQKFRTSIGAILGYLVTSGLNAFIQHRRDVRLRALAAEELLQQEEEDAADREELKHEGFQLREAVQGLTGCLQDAFRVDEENPGHIQAMASKVSAQLSDDLGRKLGEILQNTDVFRQMQDQTRDLLRHMDETAGQLRQVTDAMSQQVPQLVREMNGASIGIRDAMTSASTGFSQTVQAASSQISISLQQFNESSLTTMKGFSTAANQQVQLAVSSAVSTSLSEVIQKELGGVQKGQDVLAKQLQHLEGAIQPMLGAVNAGVSSALGGLKGEVAGFSTQMQEQLSGLKSAADSSRTVQEQTKDLLGADLNSTRNAVLKLLERLESSAGEVTQTLLVSQSTFKAVGEEMITRVEAKQGEALTELTTAHEAAAAAVKADLAEGLKIVSGKMVETAIKMEGQVAAAAEAQVAGQEGLKKTVADLTATSLAAKDTSLAAMDSLRQGIKEVRDKVDQVAAEVRVSGEETRRSVKLFHELVGGMQKKLEVLQDTVRDILARIGLGSFRRSSEIVVPEELETEEVGK
ncbi:hypothetical protein [Holophaga foetida]|uniref:hypothetical protein n=1 Tax=Holophaga foetida TaxID=35839 RepID=UPI0002474CB4|nr:hypothetical protein [Holophaga foetida]